MVVLVIGSWSQLQYNGQCLRPGSRLCSRRPTAGGLQLGSSLLWIGLLVGVVHCAACCQQCCCRPVVTDKLWHDVLSLPLPVSIQVGRMICSSAFVFSHCQQFDLEGVSVELFIYCFACVSNCIQCFHWPPPFTVLLHELIHLIHILSTSAFHSLIPGTAVLCIPNLQSWLLVRFFKQMLLILYHFHLWGMVSMRKIVRLHVKSLRFEWYSAGMVIWLEEIQMMYNFAWGLTDTSATHLASEYGVMPPVLFWSWNGLTASVADFCFQMYWIQKCCSWCC